MTFRQIATGTATLCMALFVFLWFLPGPIYWLFALDPNAAADVLARRAGAIFLGIGVLCLGSRDSEPSGARLAIARGMAVIMLALTIAGLVEFSSGRVGPGIWLAILAETGFALLWLRHAR